MDSSYPIQIAETDPNEHITDTLRAELTGLFQVTDVRYQSKGDLIAFNGRLLVNPDRSYDEIRRRFLPYGYTPMFRREKSEDVVLAMEGLVDQVKTGNPLVNILLLLATILTTLSAGASLTLGYDLLEAITSGNLYLVGQVLLAGAPFAITLLGILGVHEFGHYIAAQAHRVQATLPYFIPLPAGLGTLGALIQLKSPMKDRRVLFDIGLAGPYAGLAVAIPLFMIGLLLSSDNFVPSSFQGITLETLGASLFIKLTTWLFTDIPAGQTIQVHPILFAAWWGIFVTGINLLPVGQLDGGHAAYAILGRYAHGVALITFLILILAGTFISSYWFIWAFFIMLGGFRHPAPLNDISPIGPVRKVVGLLTIALFFLIFIPQPF